MRFWFAPIKLTDFECFYLKFNMSVSLYKTLQNKIKWYKQGGTLISFSFDNFYKISNKPYLKVVTK